MIIANCHAKMLNSLKLFFQLAKLVNCHKHRILNLILSIKLILYLFYTHALM